MSYSSLNCFIKDLEAVGELQRITAYVNPILEISEIADRVSKAGGKALLFENNGTTFPLLINAFGSEKRMAMALGRKDLEDAGNEIEKIFASVSGTNGTFLNKFSALPDMIKLAGVLPSRSKRKGRCQQIINKTPDLDLLPVLKCWPYDGNRFITLPLVHTIHPLTSKTNVGMYRMQILDKNTTAMHWQLHKTGANHFEEWKKKDEKMPVSVALGGDPVYTYAATAPLPENIDEYILAGFLRKRNVRLVKCISNDLYVPEDADIILEGYVDPREELVWEGPFGDHTGFYSLSDWYPKFHVTCITYARDAVYPATVVGIPPQEDSYFARATEKLFLVPIKLTLQPEVEDIHMPDPGVAHNLVIVKIKKSYSGQGMKIINSLLGAGQMMFTKYLIVVNGDIEIRNYLSLSKYIFKNTDFSRDLIFSQGPLDVLDHSSDSFAFGGKLGIDATEKTKDESQNPSIEGNIEINDLISVLEQMVASELIKDYHSGLKEFKLPLLILSVDNYQDKHKIDKLKHSLMYLEGISQFKVILIVDHKINVNDYFTVAWQVLGNTDPVRDHILIREDSLLIDGSIKAFRSGGFPRKWPNIVCSDNETITNVDLMWVKLGIGDLIQSPSLKSINMKYKGEAEII